MIQRDYLIIGGGIGGASVCESIRKFDKRGSVTLAGAENFLPYKRWMLSKTFLREKTPPVKKLPHVDPSWYAKHKIETRLGAMVTQLNIERRLAVLGNGETIEFNKACLAMGSRPVRPPVAGTNLGNVIYLRSTRDALALREMASLEKTVVVIGGGLLACEVAASLRKMKFKVSMMHRNPYLLNRYLDPETGAWMTGYYAKHGVTLLMNQSLNGFEGKTVLRNIQTKSGDRVAAGVAIVACGAEPNLELVRNTPLSGPHGSPVTEYLETEEKGIFAVGDLAFYPDRMMGGVRRQTHWQNARDQGLVGGVKHHGEEADSLRADSVFLDGNVRSETGFRGRLQPSADASGTARHAREEEIHGALLPGRSVARSAPLPRIAARSGIGANGVAERAGQVKPRR